VQVLEEIQRMVAPSTIDIDFTHVGVLYMIDSNTDGRFTLAEVLEFSEFCERKRRLYKPHELQTRIEGLCTLKMWHDVLQHGQLFLERWLMKLVVEIAPAKTFENYPGISYVSRDGLLPLYKVLCRSNKCLLADLFIGRFSGNFSLATSASRRFST
jgi:hypothetical protein